MADEPEVIDLLFKPFFDRLGFTESSAVFPWVKEPDQLLVRYTQVRSTGFRLALFCNGNLVWDQDFEFEAEGGMSLRDYANLHLRSEDEWGPHK